VKAEIITSFPEHFEELSELYLDEGLTESVEVEKTWFAKGCVFIKIKNIDSRNDAEALRNKYLYIPETELYPLEKDEFYHHQLIGMDVVSDEGEAIGKVEDIETYPEQDLLLVKKNAEVLHLIPLVKEIVKKVDVQARKVTIKIIDGLLG
jgi:16S rRNA processing protein RimM